MANTSTEPTKQNQLPTSHVSAHRVIRVTSKSSQESIGSIRVHHTRPSSLGENYPEEQSSQKRVLSGHTISSSYPDALLPSANDLQTYSDIVICGDIDDPPDGAQLQSALASENPNPTAERPGRVRFRSRVRITSGLRRHRHASSGGPTVLGDSAGAAHDFLTLSTASSSRSGSPSSSISAPLRTQAEDEVGKPGWGTLGQRVSLLAQGSAQRRSARDQRRRTLLTKYGTIEPSAYEALNGVHVNEQTPLIHTSLPVRYLLRSPTLEDGQSARATLDREIDLVFGPWPTRLWNHHWWWWHLETILCCRCLSDSDDEGP